MQRATSTTAFFAAARAAVLPPYVIVTAARNEAEYIELTLRSVVAQTHPPVRWLIVSDGSTDATDAIVLRYAAVHPFIELLRVDADAERNFGSKANAINAGYASIRGLPHAYVAVLDADVSFKPDYYAGVLSRFSSDPHLGIAGGILYDRRGDRFVRAVTNVNWSVSGAVQMFRRECFTAIGGYMALRGGIDAAAEVSARMKGWTVRAFPELRFLHHRPIGSENHGVLGIFFHSGAEDYRLGYHPAFFVARSLRRLLDWPWMLGSVCMLAGYAWAASCRAPLKLPADFVQYLRREQMTRLLDIVRLKRSNPGERL
jgi:biofilm PGA synthesis N-glycosyltransferase PgaC